MTKRVLCIALLWAISCFAGIAAGQANDPKRVIIICAHPDDCELTSGGLALTFIAAGHQVKCVSMTNGNKGHHLYTPEELARVRHGETQEVAKRMNCTYEVLDINDGELLPSLENRLQVIRLIREWQADIVITHRPFDYHPDHRNTSQLVQDAAFMVTVPKMLPEVPVLKRNPLFLYTRDRFTVPQPFRSDIVVDITPFIRKKAWLLDAHVSQMYEWLPWINHITTPIPKGQDERLEYLEKNYVCKRGFISEREAELLNKWYGPGRDKIAKAIEAFEVCEYGRSVTEDEIRQLIPGYTLVTDPSK